MQVRNEDSPLYREPERRECKPAIRRVASTSLRVLRKVLSRRVKAVIMTRGSVMYTLTVYLEQSVSVKLAAKYKTFGN